MPSNLYPTGVRLNDMADVLIAILAKSPVSINVTVGTLSAGDITGGRDCTLITTNAVPGTQTTRSAAQMYADDPAASPGYGYNLRVCNSGAGTITLAGGTGVTITGTATVATTIFRDYHVLYGGTPGAPTVTMTMRGSGNFV